MSRFLRGLMVVAGLSVVGAGCSSGVVAPSKSVAEAKVAEQAASQACRVRGEFSEDLRYGFLQWAIADEVPERVRRGFIIYGAVAGVGGSGFPVWTDGEKTWVATNAHVLETVDREVILTFDAGETNLNGKVVYIDTRKDIGFVEVKKRLPLVTFTSDVHEHMPVYAAGYPSGIYQITPGRVSNRCFKMSYVDRTFSEDCWVQHTAAIDPGSSGGPVFSEIGNHVIGMNTMTFRSRNDLYLALPAAVIQDRLAAARKSVGTNSKAEGRHKSLRQACHRFMAELDSSLARRDPLNRILSDELVIDRGLEALKQVKDEKDISDRQMEFLMGYYPYEIVRLAVLLQLRREAKELGGLLHDEKCENINPSDDLMDNTSVARVMVRFGDARVETAWRFDRGAWRIVYLKPHPNKDVDRPSDQEMMKRVFGKKCEDETKGRSRGSEGGCATEDSEPKDKKDKAEAPKSEEPSDKKCTCVEDEEKAECRCECEDDED